MNTPFPPFSQKLLVMTISIALGIDFSSVANAQSPIALDGSTGTGTGANQSFAGIAGANQTITINGDGANANGTIVGSNLFFSFNQFGIAAGDTALFQCPSGCAGVTNVISRVTGGVSTVGFTPTAANPSNLLGTLTSTIGTANFWFFNPNGVGVSGAVNVPVSASYFISNADRLNFSNGTFFGTGNPIPTGSTLSVATPSAFGFPTTQAVSTVAAPVSLNSASSQQVFTNGPITITYPAPIIVTGTNTPVLTPVTTPVVVSTPVTTPVVVSTPVTTPVTVVSTPVITPVTVVSTPVEIVPTLVTTPVDAIPTPVPTTPAPTLPEPAKLQISPQGDISMVVANQPVMVDVTVLPLPKPVSPCDSDGQSSLISKGIAAYIPELNSQAPQSLLAMTTGAISLASVEQSQPLTLNESVNCP
jgi:filamentous hemagglutinin family protein